jgi:threonine dehydratase
MAYTLALEDFEAARERIRPYVRHTPILPPPQLRGGDPYVAHNQSLPANLQLKLENLQVSGSFKIRGAYNTLLQLDAEQRQRGVITASGGNHGVAVAYAAWQLRIPAIVYLPERASADREARIAAWGAQVIRYGEAWDYANNQALLHAERDGLAYIPAFDAEKTMLGQGTLGLELLDDVPELDCVLIAIGGGGLIGGMAAAIKQRRPNVRIIGVEPTGAASMLHSLRAGYVNKLPHTSSIIDTLSPLAVSESTLSLAQQYVDDVVLCDDEQSVAAMRWLWTECNQLVEPAGAITLAALMTGAVDLSSYAHPVALVCGGNAAVEGVFDSYLAAAKAKAS